MGLIDRILDTCNDKCIRIARLEKDCGFSNGYIKGLKKDYMPFERVNKIAEYLDVSPDWLITGETKENTNDIVVDIELGSLLAKISRNEGLAKKIMKYIELPISDKDIIDKLIDRFYNTKEED